MFFNKKIKEAEARISALEETVHELAHKTHEQAKEIDKLYALFVNKVMESKPAMEQKTEQKPKNYRPRRRAKKMMTDGKENTEATE